MTAREILRAAHEASVALQDLERQRKKYDSMIGGTGMHFGAQAMTRDNRSRVEELAIKMADLELELQDEATVYLSAIQEARRLIYRLPPQHQRVLVLRYLCGMRWDDISAELGYHHPKSVYRAHGWALKAADDLLHGKA